MLLLLDRRSQPASIYHATHHLIFPTFFPDKSSQANKVILAQTSNPPEIQFTELQNG